MSVVASIGRKHKRLQDLMTTKTPKFCFAHRGEIRRIGREREGEDLTSSTHHYHPKRHLERRGRRDAQARRVALVVGVVAEQRDRVLHDCKQFAVCVARVVDQPHPAAD